MFLMLLTLIAIFLIDSTLGKAFDSQCNNKDIFSKRLKRKATCKGNATERSCQLLHDPSEIRNKQHNVPTGIEPLSLSGFLDKTTGLFQSMDYVPMFPTGIEPLSISSPSNKTKGLFQSMDYVPNDFPPITTSSFLQRYVRMNATIAHVSATTATTNATITQVPATNATMTQVPATRSATMNAPKYQLDKCNATQAQNKTRSPSILHPPKKAANYATPKNLLLFFV
jgi:hypothetical protein